jgi:hypothetical protein
MESTTTYEIRISGLLDRRWWVWFDGYTITSDRPDETVLLGQTSDQRSLIGTLVTLHQLGYPLVSLARRPD